uniref:Homeobox domain-containing protein n=1 Tax=Ananas comosus var. bracteatus TaxID=296719 RepID=A0A6V7NQ92_ANACO|nr:unnamed protein product [Ananas comosus var. bracteatus]
MHGFDSNHDLFAIQAASGLDMVGFSSKQHQIISSNHVRGFFPKELSNIASSVSPWPIDDTAIRHHSGGLSLSLSNPRPSSDAFGLAHDQPFNQGDASHNHHGLLSRASASASHQQQLLMHEGMRAFHSQQTFQLGSSKYMIPARELLNEFCSLGGDQSSLMKKPQKSTSQWEEGASSSSTSWGHQSLHSLDLLELQKRRAKLFTMLEEVDRRYRKYCEQMRAVVSSFEAIRATKKAMGEKEPVAPGMTRGETPRLKILDQCLRQQKAFQQGSFMETHPWRPQRGLPERSVSILRAWLFEHFLHPYPNDVDKHILSRQTGLSRSQVSNWFINARVRLWKPMVEEMYMEEMKEQEKQSSNLATGHQDTTTNQNPNPKPHPGLDQKPPPGRHLIPNSDSLSSVVNGGHSRDQGENATMKSARHHDIAANFGMEDWDFPSYNNGGHNLGSSVSLTLGLQQHNGGGMSLSFAPPPNSRLSSSPETISTTTNRFTSPC